MCRTLLTVVHHACQPGHLTRQTRTEQCYTAHLFGMRVCAPGPPRHSFYEQHLPGAACQSCVYHHRAYNTDAEDEVNDDDDMDIDIDPAALHNQRLLFRQNALYHPASYVARPLSLLPATANPPYLGTGQHTHEQVPYAGPSVPMGARSPHVNRPPVDPFAQPHDLPQGNEYPSDNYPRDVSPSASYPSEYPSGYPSGDGYDEAANGPHEPAQVQAQQQQPSTHLTRGPLVPIMEDEREYHSDTSHGAGSEDFVHIERPSQFDRNPSPRQSPPPIPRRRRPYLSRLPLPRRSPSTSPPMSSGYYSSLMGNLRGGDSGSSSDYSSTLAPPSDEAEAGDNDDNDDDEERQLLEALERSAREFAEQADAEQRRAAQRSLREHADREEDALRRVAAESLRDYADAEHAALVRAMHDSAAEAEERRKRVEKDEEREVLRRSVRTWREEVAVRMGASSERGSGREDGDGDGVGVFRGFADLDDLWTKRVGVDHSNAEKGESSTAQRSKGMENQDHHPPTPSSPKPAQRVCPPPPPTVEDEPERSAWSFEGVANQPQAQDDEPAIMGPADEITRAMEAVDLSTDPAEYIRTQRLARFTRNKDEQ
ncbi:hypothetical protein DIS24_g4451 [Lasiodiplodia hormozganensis]|uniref:Uncharacterized protein n=1 Tax=Lasiodiplodia hormozganensis TaxID=869390 RepID=A0AA39YW76_9PEZI|nr:hypothetical protein DIS24_g4451 [Lasiodiplodia hormozganensis]